MKKTTRICLLFLSAVSVCCLAYGGGYYFSSFLSGNRLEQKPALEEEQAQEEYPNSINSSAVVVPYEFVLCEEEGYIIVYCADKETIYATTGIKVDNLSTELQREILAGKPIYSESELYNFLESHSS